DDSARWQMNPSSTSTCRWSRAVLMCRPTSAASSLSRLPGCFCTAPSSSTRLTSASPRRSFTLRGMSPLPCDRLDEEQRGAHLHRHSTAGRTSVQTSGRRIPQPASSGSRLVWAGTHPRPSSARRMNMSKFDVVEASIADLRTALEDGTTTSVELVRSEEQRGAHLHRHSTAGRTSVQTSGRRIPQPASSGSRLVWAGTHPRPSSARRMNMSKFDVVEASIADLRTALEDGTTTSVELVEAYQD